MSFDSSQFRELVRAVLQELNLEIPYSEVAVELLMLTASQESHLGKYIKQINGPARGVFQMEPRTEADIWDNYLKYKPNLRMLVEGFKHRHVMDQGMNLQANLPYQIAMARVHYFRVSSPLPSSGGASALASYWKKHYNTYLGAGTVEEAVENYKRYGVKRLT